MALHREKRKYKTKSGKTAYRSMMVAAQGQPQMRLRLKQGGPAKSGAPRKGAILGAVVGAVGGAAVGALGGAAMGAAAGNSAFHATIRHTSGPYYNPLQDAQFMGVHGQNMHRLRVQGTSQAAGRGALVGTAAGSILGAVGGAVSGYAAGRAVAAVQKRRSGGQSSRSPHVLKSR